MDKTVGEWIHSPDSLQRKNRGERIMKKSKAWIGLIIILVCSIALGFVAFVGIGSGGKGSYKNIRLGLDLAGGASITYEAAGDQTPSDEDMNDTVYKLQRRVEQYSQEAQVYREGDKRIAIEIPGISGVEETNKILSDLGRPGSLYFIRQTNDDGEANYTLGANADGSYGYVLSKEIDELIESGDVVLTGTDVADAQAGYQQDSMNNSEIVVSLTFTDEGKVKFADATTRAYQNGESIAIYYDGQFISVPTVQAAITNGQAVITGESTIEDAQTLASTIRIGGLKVELQRLRSNIVGAQLGQDAISTSLKAGAIGFILIIVFMIGVYFIPGIAASLSLVIYTILIALILNAFDLTLTLPGIAGIILSIGMAVDANVVIFARIREEIAEGANVKTAMRVGYQKALSAIIDGNVTTLIAAAVLALLGSGSVKGFAQTLAIGIILSMFTALVICRLIMNIFYAIGLKSEKLYGRSKERKNIGFVEHRKIILTVSAIAILSGFVAMGIHSAGGDGALNLSLDFIGGTSTTVTFNEDMELAEIDEKVVPIFEEVTGDANVQVQKVTGSTEVVFKTAELSEEQGTSIATQMIEKFEVDKDKITTETISSTISSEMKQDAVIAVIVAMILMLIYIWFRFRDIRFGTSAVFALVHDVLVVLASYAILRVSVGSTFIACMLTIVGYSINASIVVFDRIRENLAFHRNGSDLAEIVDRSVTQTLSRSLFTSLTTFFMIFMLYIFGVSSIREFALPIMVGVVSGAWSSVCIAGNLWYIFRTKFKPGHDDGKDHHQTPGGGNRKKKYDDSNLSRKQRKQLKQREIEEKNKAKITV